MVTQACRHVRRLSSCLVLPLKLTHDLQVSVTCLGGEMGAQRFLELHSVCKSQEPQQDPHAGPESMASSTHGATRTSF